MFQDKEAEDGRILLKFIFGLPLLSPAKVEDCFFVDIIALRPVRFSASKYLLLNRYITVGRIW